MIEPISNIAPLREDLSKLVPDSFLITTAFKRWTVQIGINDVWKQYLDSVKVPIVGYYPLDNIPGDALTLLLNDYCKDTENLGSFIFQLLELYSKENDGDFDVDDICKDLEIINVSKDTIDKIKTLNKKSKKIEEDEDVLTEEQKVRKKEDEYKRLINAPNSKEAIHKYLEWYNAALMYLSDHYTITTSDYAKFKSLDNSGNGYTLCNNYQSIYAIYNLLMKNASKQIVVGNQSKKKTPMVFISHASVDTKFAEALVDMLEGIGLNQSTLFCSSVDGYKIPLGQNIFDYLYALFQEHELFVIFVHTPNYYKSPACLNEMGAAWVLKTNYYSILSKDMSFDDMKGVVKPDTISIKVDKDEDAPGRLTELKDKLIKILKLEPIDEILWERKRNNFLRLVNSL
jgi:hypothetical protein